MAKQKKIVATGRYEYYSFRCWRAGKSFGKIRWDFRYRFQNGNILCFSRQGYNRLSDVMDGIAELQISDGVKIIRVDK